MLLLQNTYDVLLINVGTFKLTSNHVKMDHIVNIKYFKY